MSLLLGVSRAIPKNTRLRPDTIWPMDIDPKSHGVTFLHDKAGLGTALSGLHALRTLR